ncbi:replication protein A 32 kDa subunit-like isoform X2 [Sander lucioperca]|uniref:replication protein A 32 kDa subunit-like isoform X2 n=1 Tax=Sander lucioperca TaxID=283035 RepID=UPI001653D8FF|nr:replication protein A 32 kDa subunit-like isoform X2 [Sander lucioperca]
MWNQACSQPSDGMPSHKATVMDSFSLMLPQRTTLLILPCTVSQLLSASRGSDRTFTICNWELNQVSVVGIIRGSAPFVTNIQYSVDDMTGPPLNVKQWVNTEACASPGTYVKVTGTLRSLDGQRSLLAMDIRCIKDLNEITSHMLEVVRAHMQLFGKVMHVIRRFSVSDIGIGFHELQSQLNYLSMGDLRASLTFLINEGHVFSTIDEHHFKSTEH